MKVAKKGSGKGTATKGPPAGSEGNPHKRVESARISSDIADYVKAGGQVEKLGVTRVLQKIEGTEVEKPKPAGRPRSR
ncbi:MAG TPA: hypothetical protein VIT22_05450 [Pseudoxanthomonas sp.]